MERLMKKKFGVLFFGIEVSGFDVLLESLHVVDNVGMILGLCLIVLVLCMVGIPYRRSYRSRPRPYRRSYSLPRPRKNLLTVISDFIKNSFGGF